MDRCLQEACAAQKEIRALLRPAAEEKPADKEEGPEKKMDQYHELSLSHEHLRVSPFDQPTTGTADSDEAMVVCTSGCLGPKTPIIHPDSMALLMWVLIGAGFICYDILIMPYRMCFNAPAKGPFFRV